jgi:DnaJ-class molecular chaperone
MGREAMEKMASTGSTLKKAAQEKGTTIRSHVEKQKSARRPKSPNLEMDTQPSPADDILSDIFTTVRPSHTEVAAEDGRDVNYTLDISFEESALGLTRRVKLPDGRRLEVEIPKGVKNGQRIRLRGEGTQGKGEGLPGDALIKIGVEPHPFFSRSGNDINLTLPVTVDEAVLGAKVMVPTLTDPVAITVPPGSNTDTRIVVDDMGFAPDTGEADQKNGDQVIILKVILPSPKDTVFSRLVRRWATKNPYNVRDEFDICARAG